MGLDMTVSIEGQEGFYYRLNWYGVSYENKYMGAIIQHLLGKTKKTSLRNVKTNTLYLVEGKKYNYQGNQVRTAEVVKGDSIKKVNHKNLIKIKSGFKGMFLSQYKIFEINKNESLMSAVSFISLNNWNGLNGEVYSFSKKDGIISFNEVYWEENEDDATEKKLFSLNPDDVIEIGDIITEMIQTLKNVESNCRENIFFDEYINENNIKILKMMQEFFKNDDVSYFTVSYG